MRLDAARINYGKLAKRILLYFVVSLICIVILYPYFVMFLTALKSREEIFSPTGTIFPRSGIGTTSRRSLSGLPWLSTC